MARHIRLPSWWWMAVLAFSALTVIGGIAGLPGLGVLLRVFITASATLRSTKGARGGRGLGLPAAGLRDGRARTGSSEVKAGGLSGDDVSSFRPGTCGPGEPSPESAIPAQSASSRGLE